VRRGVVCLGPYNISSPSFPGETGPVFIDLSKTRRVAVLTPHGDEIRKPSVDAIILNEFYSETCTVKWYECPGEMGRQYTLIPTACNVIITSFENGVTTLGECSASDYGIGEFCFGKNYTSTEVINSDDNKSFFVFDTHTFTVTGHLSEDSSIFDCSSCWSEVEAFSDHTSGQAAVRELPTAPPDFVEEVTETSFLEGTSITDERRLVWNEESTTSPNVDDVELIACATTLEIVGEECESVQNPDISISQFGDALVAYELRDKEGLTRVTTTNAATSTNKIIYHRSLSYGRLINSDTSTTTAVLEIYDDIELSDVLALQLGFLSGPLAAGDLFEINSIERVVVNNIPKHVIEFVLAGRELVFPDSNDIYDIRWFLVDASGVSLFSTLGGPRDIRSSMDGANIPTPQPLLPVKPFNVEKLIVKSMQACEDRIIGIWEGDEIGHGRYWANRIYTEEVFYIKEIRMPMSVPSGLNLFWYVGKKTGSGEAGEIEIISEIITSSGSGGQGEYSTGDVNIPILNVNGDYFIGVAISAGDGAANANITVGTYSTEENFSEFQVTGTYISGAAPPLRKINWHTNQYSNGAYAMTVCVSSNDGGGIFTPGHDPATEDTCIRFGGDDDSSDDGFFYHANSLFTHNDMVGNGTYFVKEIKQKLQVQNVGQKIYFTIHVASRDDSEPIFYKEVVADVAGTPVWYSTGPINVEISYQPSVYLIGASTRTPNTIYFKSSQSWINTYSILGTGARGIDDGVIAPLNRPINSTAASERTTNNVWSQQICIARTQGGPLTPVPVVDAGHYGWISYAHSDEIDTDSAIQGGLFNAHIFLKLPPHLDKIFITEIGVRLNLPSTGINLNFLVLKYISANRAEFFKKKTVTMTKSGDQYYFSGPLDWELPVTSTSLSGAGYYIGVGWGNIGSAVTWYMHNHNSLAGVFTPYGYMRGGNLEAEWNEGVGEEVTVNWADFDKSKTNDIVIQFSDSINPPVSGACCNNGGCENLTESECVGAGANFQGNGTNCYSFNCFNISGACCLGDGSCVDDITVTQCLDQGGFHQGENSRCSSSECERGACCFIDLTCLDLTQNDCSGQGGFFRGFGTACSSQDCGVAACCLSPTQCIDTTRGDCESQNGEWRPSSVCSTTDCSLANTGACCYGQGRCVETSLADCETTYEGTFFGVGTSCFTTNCPLTGGCCLPSDDCIEASFADCQSQNGRYFGNNTICEEVDCTEPFGACCLPDGFCTQIPLIDCISAGGIYFGDNLPCANINCTPSSNVGACCFRNGDCLALTEDECIDEDGSFQGIGITCNEANCQPDPLTNAEVLSIPDEGIKTVNPSIVTTKNNFGIDRAEHTYVAYQTFEDEEWNVYLRQLRRISKEETPPVYESPFDFTRPTFELQSIASISSNTVIYETDTVISSNNNICAIFSVYLPSGRQVMNCDENAVGNEILTFCGVIKEADIAWVEAIYSISASCPLDNAPSWFRGERYVGSYPPDAAMLGANSAAISCISFNFYPDTSEWCYQNPSCIQRHLFDDQICPSEYTAITYKPADLWNLEVDGNIITRVKYHMEIDAERYESGTSAPVAGFGSPVDFMFVIDHSRSMGNHINAVRSAVSEFMQRMFDDGVDIRFGLCVYGFGGTSGAPAVTCGTGEIFNGLYGISTESFTTSISELEDALTNWGVGAASAPGYVAIQYSLEDDNFVWRENAKRYIFLITDTKDNEGPFVTCSGYSNSQSSAINDAVSKNCTILLALCTNEEGCSYIDEGGGTNYIPLGPATGWDSSAVCPNPDDPTACGYFYVGGPYDTIFRAVEEIILSTLIARSIIVERDTRGYGATFLKPAEVIITYNEDLSDLWTQSKNDLVFRDVSPQLGVPTKGLTGAPFTLGGTIYGIDPVHLHGKSQNWVFFDEPGNIRIQYPNVGVPNRNRSNQKLIANSAKNPKIAVNNRNELFIAYESIESGTEHIVIKGTGDFAQSSIAGPKGSRITRFFSRYEFDYQHDISLPGEGVNQLGNLVIDKNDIIHVTWQSNRDGYWEVYYANGFNLFEPIRVTKSESRSGYPAIDIDDDGNVFVVYHDNRFGPYNIMLSVKHDRRILPLLQQDAYLASLRSFYEHFTNVLPITVTNASVTSQLPGFLWATRLEYTGSGSDNLIFDIDVNSGEIDNSGGSLGNIEIVALAGSTDGNLYGISSNGTVYLLSSGVSDDEYQILNLNDITLIGTIGDLPLPEYQIVDAAIDHRVEHLWVLLASADSIIILEVGLSHAELLSETLLYSSCDEAQGGLAILSDGTFMVARYENGLVKLSSSTYPDMLGSSVIFNFADINADVGYDLTGLTADHQDLVYAADTGRSLFTITSSGSINVVGPIQDTDDSTPEVGQLSLIVGFGYQYSGIEEEVGTPAFFHVILEFYDNKNMLGEPTIKIDSRENHEAFSTTNQADSTDAYLDGVRGLYLKSGTTGIMYFNAYHYRPTYSKRSIPYGFDTNQSYFVKTFVIQGDDISEGELQNTSFSCNKCSRYGSNLFDIEGCSYSFVITNNTDQTRYYNFRVDFYADEGKESIIRRFDLNFTSGDLSACEVDNAAAASKWLQSGLPTQPLQSRFIQIYPALADEQFICGLNYHVSLSSCSSNDEVLCDDYETILIVPSEWSESSLEDSLNTSDLFGISSAEINGIASVAWIAGNGRLKFAQLNSAGKWESEEVDASACSAPDLKEINERASIAYTTGGILKYAIRLNYGWDIDNTGLTAYVPSLINYNETPSIVFIENKGYEYLIKRTVKTGAIWTTETIMDTGDSASFIVPHAIINDIPAICYKTSGRWYYADRSTGAWVIDQSTQLIQISEGRIKVDSLFEFNSQPFVVGNIDNAAGVFWATSSDGTSWNGERIDASAVGNKHGGSLISGFPSAVYFAERPVSGELDLNTSNRESAVATVLEETADDPLDDTATLTSDFLESGAPTITYDLIFARLIDVISNQWLLEIVSSGFSVDDLTAQKSLASVSDGAIVFPAIQPLRVYLSNLSLTGETGFIGAGMKYFCECSSNIFDSPMTNIERLGRWHSSGQGHLDTRVTDSPGDTLRPDIDTRSTGAAIITFEDYNSDPYLGRTQSRIKSASFRVANIDEVFGSGTRSWFELDTQSKGRDVSTSIDIYDRINSSFEIPNAPGLSNELPTGQIRVINCKFNDDIVSTGAIDDQCDITDLEANVITEDPFIARQIIRQLSIKKEDVEYFTYNSSNEVVPAVTKCEIKLQLWGSPEVVAYRIKNEDTPVFGKWCAWNPDINDYYTETTHTISNGSGVKEICVQAMTYAGITAQFCLSVIADYQPTIFELRFYSDETYETLTPVYNGFYVVSVASNTELGKITNKVYIEIIPSSTVNSDTIHYDVEQQGSNDQFGLSATVASREGRQVFRGFFDINKEDNIFNKDGIARIQVRFPGTCERAEFVSKASFTKNILNVVSDDATVIQSTEDELADYRQEISGRVGSGIILRPSEDPYLIFGDPNYFLGQKEPKQTGVQQAKDNS